MMSLRELKNLIEDREDIVSILPVQEHPPRYQLRRTVSKDGEDDASANFIPKSSGISITQKRKVQLERDAKGFKIEQEGVLPGGKSLMLHSRFIPAYHARDAILHLALSGILDDHLTAQWKEVVKMKVNADKGDTTSMVNLAYWLVNPEGNDSHIPSFVEEKKAFELWKAAADLGNIEGMAEAGESLVEGIGVEQNYLLGMQLIEKAARNGFANACLSLALDYAMALNGVDKSVQAAKYWVERALDPNYCWPLDKTEQEIAERLLAELLEEEEE